MRILLLANIFGTSDILTFTSNHYNIRETMYHINDKVNFIAGQEVLISHDETMNSGDDDSGEDSGPEDEYSHPSPAAVAYAPENVPGKGCQERIFFQRLRGCGCSGGNCSSSDPCQCFRGFGPNYDANGIIINQDSSNSKPIFECHSDCGCKKDACLNRVVQKGPVKGLKVAEAASKGLGLFIDQFLRRGSFVCCYAGEVIGEEEANARLKRADEMAGSMNYVIFADERSSEDGRLMARTVVDPTAVGNVGRYANHSCSPNMAMRFVRTSSPVPHLALFALRDVTAGEELTFDYGDDDDDITQMDKNAQDNERTSCKCGAANCRRSLPFHPRTADRVKDIPTDSL